MSASETKPESKDIDMSWDDVNSAIANLLGQFKEDNYRPSHIIAVAKGGVIPASLIHQAFPTACFSAIYIRSYVGFETTPPVVVGGVPHAVAWSQTLIVDDILETGTTRDFLMKLYPMATYAFMACRWSQAGNCRYRGYIAPPGWINFPWEKTINPIETPF